MRRMACVELPRFRLQLLLREHDEWRNMPVALLSEDRPLAPVLEVNSAAHKAGVEPGMKYATALAVVPNLQAGVIREDSVEQAVRELHSIFRKFSPAVLARLRGAFTAVEHYAFMDAGSARRNSSTRSVQPDRGRVLPFCDICDCIEEQAKRACDP